MSTILYYYGNHCSGWIGVPSLRQFKSDSNYETVEERLIALLRHLDRIPCSHSRESFAGVLQKRFFGKIVIALPSKSESHPGEPNS